MKRTMFIGQAMPRFKAHPHDWPTLNKWLYSIGLTDDHIAANFFYSALVDYFPGAKSGSHLVPTPEEILKEQARLKKDILKFDPQIIVPIGRLSIAYCFDETVKPLTDYIGKSYKTNPYQMMKSEIIVVPFPHPSGASTWHHKKENKELLRLALLELKNNLN